MNFRKRTRTDFIAIHCSAHPAGSDKIGASDIRRMHRERGWTDIGYHYVIRTNGTVEPGRPEDTYGAHEPSINSRSVAVCLIGGSPPIGTEAHRKGLGENNYTPAQWASLEKLVTQLHAKYPTAAVVGHRDIPGVKKACPSFDAKAWWETVKPN